MPAISKHQPYIAPNGLELLKSRRYLQPGETPASMFARVGQAVAAAEPTPNLRTHYSKAFTSLLISLRFLPNTPTLVHAGVPVEDGHPPKCLSACFVDSPYDNLESITRIGHAIPHVETAGGGMGWGLSRLRPKGDKLGDRESGACGPVAVLRWYAQAGRTFTQGATRPGAHMAQLHISHPDISEFIHCKDSCLSPSDPLANVNISVQVTDAFMEAALRGHMWPLINPRTGESADLVDASTLWSDICASAWKTGDPGVVFVDRINGEGLLRNPAYGPIQSSNPCGEEFLEDQNSCNLGSLDLSKYRTNSGVDMESLEVDVRLAVRFLDDVIDINHFPFPEYRQVNLDTRRIGLGVMGWADLLSWLDIPYGSDRSLEIARHLSRRISEIATLASIEIGQEKGTPRSDMATRNSSLTTIAPTGSISIIAGCSPGIEPHFSLFWTRKALWSADGEHHDAEFVESPSPLKHLLGGLNIAKSEADQREIAALTPHEQRRRLTGWLAERHVNSFPTAHDISPTAHAAMQAAWQSGIHNGVSKTVNLGNDATVEDIGEVYKYAHGAGCKAITVYRDGSKNGQVLQAGVAATSGGAGDDDDDGAKAVQGVLDLIDVPTSIPSTIAPVVGHLLPQARPKILRGRTATVATGHGTWFITVNGDPETGHSVEVFITPSNNDPCVKAAAAAVAKLMSLSLRSGVDAERLAGALSGLDCGHPHWADGQLVKSVWDGLAQFLLELESEADGNDSSGITASNPSDINPLTTCPHCGGTRVNTGGCLRCQSCGSTSCE